MKSNLEELVKNNRASEGEVLSRVIKKGGKVYIHDVSYKREIDREFTNWDAADKVIDALKNKKDVHEALEAMQDLKEQEFLDIIIVAQSYLKE